MAFSGSVLQKVLINLTNQPVTFIHFSHDSLDEGTISNDFVHAVYEDKSGSLWVGTGNGLDRLDRKTGKFIHYWNDPEIRQVEFKFFGITRSNIHQPIRLHPSMRTEQGCFGCAQMERD